MPVPSFSVDLLAAFALFLGRNALSLWQQVAAGVFMDQHFSLFPILSYRALRGKLASLLPTYPALEFFLSEWPAPCWQ
jgi:hypothetical protein